jgi:hypothetical protein
VCVLIVTVHVATAASSAPDQSALRADLSGPSPEPKRKAARKEHMMGQLQPQPNTSHATSERPTAEKAALKGPLRNSLPVAQTATKANAQVAYLHSGR